MQQIAHVTTVLQAGDGCSTETTEVIELDVNTEATLGLSYIVF